MNQVWVLKCISHRLSVNVPRRAYLSRGGPICPEAGLSAPRRAYLSQGGPVIPKAGLSQGHGHSGREKCVFQMLDCLTCTSHADIWSRPQSILGVRA